jgi:hypothetical protein
MNSGRNVGTDLEIGRTADLTNLLTYETERSTRVPTQPRYVFSDVPMAAWGSVAILQVRLPLPDPCRMMHRSLPAPDRHSC